uniref:PilZ domain-containing protein n=1 Tax=Acetatifactor sp. TaxID=1872090 RepID=UPI004056C962
MYINEMAVGSEVLLEVKNKEGKEVTLTTQIVSAYEAGGYKMVLVEALRHNGHLLVFSAVTCTAMVTNAEDGRLYVYKLQGVLKRENEGTIYHCLIANEDVAEENRRGAKRFGVGEKASIQILGTTNVLRGHVHDISATGISFLVNDAHLNMGDKVAISFTHEITGATVKVVAEVVRQQEHEKGVKFGCVVQKHDAKYNMLISYLMRQECKVKQ